MDNKPFTPYVYRVTNKITGQFYIGMKVSPGEIGVDYFTSSTNKAFKQDFKENTCNYICEKLVESTDKGYIAEQEAYFIKENFNNNLCLNLAYRNGLMHKITRHCSEETKEKISKKNKGRKHTDLEKSKMKGNIPWNKGRCMTAEELKEHSIRMKIAMNSEETRAKCSKSHRGLHPKRTKKLTTDQKAKISQTLKDYYKSIGGSPKKGTQLSGETKKKISETVKKSFTPERRAFQSQLHKGKSSWNKGIPMSEETRKKLSEANKGKKWYNNGVISKCLFECPEGWKIGRIYKRKNKGKGDYNTEHEDK